MFNMNIKPRLAHIESGAVVEDTDTRLRGFVICNDKQKYQVAIVGDNGGMYLSEQEYDKDIDVGLFFSTYKMIAQRNEYEAKLEGVINAKSV